MIVNTTTIVTIVATGTGTIGITANPKTLLVEISSAGLIEQYPDLFSVE